MTVCCDRAGRVHHRRERVAGFGRGGGRRAPEAVQGPGARGPDPRGVSHLRHLFIYFAPNAGGLARRVGPWTKSLFSGWGGVLVRGRERVIVDWFRCFWGLGSELLVLLAHFFSFLLFF